jgi:hypothetical protein
MTAIVTCSDVRYRRKLCTLILHECLYIVYDLDLVNWDNHYRAVFSKFVVRFLYRDHRGKHAMERCIQKLKIVFKQT